MESAHTTDLVRKIARKCSPTTTGYPILLWERKTTLIMYRKQSKKAIDRSVTT
jgi:hypothetical protein